MSEVRQLLAQYAKESSEPAFRELVDRYVDLVYSAALRLVHGDSHLAEDVTQTVFADLAQMARGLSKEVMLGGWLHRHTCFVASKILRTERRRQERERQAVEMNSQEDHAAANLAIVAPILDEAINELGAEDRQAILLRYFEQQEFRSVGQAMGSNEEAARKRVNRALDKLQKLLVHRGATLSTSALAAALGTQAVCAAPVGMAAVVATAALTGTAAAAATGGATLTVIGLMSTKLKIAIIVAAAAGVAIPLVMQHRANSALLVENETLRQQAAQVGELKSENEKLATRLARTTNTPPASLPNDQFLELQRLRSEVGSLRKYVKAAADAPKKPGPSPLSGLTANPEMAKMIRTQQKAGMSMIYKNFAKMADIPDEQAQKLYDVLADDVMEKIGHVSSLLTDPQTPEARDQIFAQADLELNEKVRELLGDEGLAKYQDFTKNLGSHLTAEQFKGKLTGDESAKAEKAKQIEKLMQEETSATLASAGLDPNYQIVPILNFRNIASEQDGERSIKLLDSIYERLSGRLGTVLSPEEQASFKEFRKAAVDNNNGALLMNRKMMAPTQPEAPK